MKTLEDELIEQSCTITFAKRENQGGILITGNGQLSDCMALCIIGILEFAHDAMTEFNEQTVKDICEDIQRMGKLMLKDTTELVSIDLGKLKAAAGENPAEE